MLSTLAFHSKKLARCCKCKMMICHRWAKRHKVEQHFAILNDGRVAWVDKMSCKSAINQQICNLYRYTTSTKRIKLSAAPALLTNYRAVHTAAASLVQHKASNTRTTGPSMITKKGETTKLDKTHTTSHPVQHRNHNNISSNGKNDNHHANIVCSKATSVKKMPIGDKTKSKTLQREPTVKSKRESDTQSISKAACKANKTAETVTQKNGKENNSISNKSSKVSEMASKAIRPNNSTTARNHTHKEVISLSKAKSISTTLINTTEEEKLKELGTTTSNDNLSLSPSPTASNVRNDVKSCNVIINNDEEKERQVQTKENQKQQQQQESESKECESVAEFGSGDVEDEEMEEFVKILQEEVKLRLEMENKKKNKGKRSKEISPSSSSGSLQGKEGNENKNITGSSSSNNIKEIDNNSLSSSSLTSSSPSPLFSPIILSREELLHNKVDRSFDNNINETRTESENESDMNRPYSSKLLLDLLGPEDVNLTPEGVYKTMEGEILSPEQCRAVALALQRQNLFITGGAGTGKSLVIREIVRKLRERRYNVYITATTGVAALNVRGSTINSFAGIHFGQGTVEELVKRVRRSRQACGRWMYCGTLIIDEISMMSADLLEKLNAVAQRIRKQPDKPFGGIQVILCGDFLQLPPITRRAGFERMRAPVEASSLNELLQQNSSSITKSNNNNNEISSSDSVTGAPWWVKSSPASSLSHDALNTQYCFQCPTWHALQLINVILIHKHRQDSDEALQRVLDEARIGALTVEGYKLLTSRTLPIQGAPAFANQHATMNTRHAKTQAKPTAASMQETNTTRTINNNTNITNNSLVHVNSDEYVRLCATNQEVDARNATHFASLLPLTQVGNLLLLPPQRQLEEEMKVNKLLNDNMKNSISDVTETEKEDTLHPLYVYTAIDILHNPLGKKGTAAMKEEYIVRPVESTRAKGTTAPNANTPQWLSHRLEQQQQKQMQPFTKVKHANHKHKRERFSKDGTPIVSSPFDVRSWVRFEDSSLQFQLPLKVGTRVMLLTNISTKLGLVNGSVGIVTGFLHPFEMLDLVLRSYREMRTSPTPRGLELLRRSGFDSMRDVYRCIDTHFGQALSWYVRTTFGKCIHADEISYGDLYGASHLRDLTNLLDFNELDASPKSDAISEILENNSTRLQESSELEETSKHSTKRNKTKKGNNPVNDNSDQTQNDKIHNVNSTNGENGSMKMTNGRCNDDEDEDKIFQQLLGTPDHDERFRTSNTAQMLEEIVAKEFYMTSLTASQKRTFRLPIVKLDLQRAIRLRSNTSSSSSSNNNKPSAANQVSTTTASTESANKTSNTNNNEKTELCSLYAYISPIQQNWYMGQSIAATRTQLPLRHAWAITVHKSQGLTIGKLEVDMRRFFTPGQSYVALSRGTRLESMRLLNFRPETVVACPVARGFYETIIKEQQLLEQQENTDEYEKGKENVSENNVSCKNKSSERITTNNSKEYQEEQHPLLQQIAENSGGGAS